MTPFIGLFTSPEISKMSKDKFNVKRALWNGWERKRGEAFSRIANFRFQDPSSPLPKNISYISSSNEPCISVKIRLSPQPWQKSSINGGTRENTVASKNQRSISFEKNSISYPLKKEGGERKKRETKEEKGSSPPMLKIERLNNDTRY